MKLDNTSEKNFEILNDLIESLLVEKKGVVEFSPGRRRSLELSIARKLAKTLKRAAAEMDDLVMEQTHFKLW